MIKRRRSVVRDIITRKDTDSVVFSMIKVLTEGTEKTLQEVLYLMESCFGEGELSVVSCKDRRVIATTREDVDCSREVAFRVKDAWKRFYYFKEEENGMYFVEDIGCIRIYPLASMGGEDCFLMVEQHENIDSSTERMLDMVSIATRIHLQEVNRQSILKTDILTGLGNRDSLQSALADFAPEDSKDIYVGIFSLCNMQELVVKEGMVSVENVICKIAATICEFFPEHVYRVSDYKFCIWQKGGVYEVVSLMQDCLDKLIELLPKMEFSCVVTPSLAGYYKALYLCEKASDTEKGDTVVLIREANTLFDIGELETSLFVQALHKKREEKGIYEEVDYPKEDSETDM